MGHGSEPGVNYDGPGNPDTCGYPHEVKLREILEKMELKDIARELTAEFTRRMDDIRLEGNADALDLLDEAEDHLFDGLYLEAAETIDRAQREVDEYQRSPEFARAMATERSIGLILDKHGLRVDI